MTKITRIIALVFLIGFLLPYLAVSCSGQEIAEVNGVKAAFGGDVEIGMPDMGDLGDMGDLDSDVGTFEMVMPVLIALILGVVGALIIFVKDIEIEDGLKKVLMAIYAAATVAIFLAPGVAENQLLDEEGMDAIIKVEPKIGYYITIIAAIGMVVYIYMNKDKQPEPEVIDVESAES